MKTRYFVTYGEVSTYQTAYYDGETHHMYEARIGISFSEPCGREWNLLHTFDKTPEGEAQVQRICQRIQRVLDADGPKSLNTACWSHRTIYGSDLYQEEEAFVVQREKEDALAGL